MLRRLISIERKRPWQHQRWPRFLWRDVSSFVAECAAKDAERLFLWVPVLLGCGIGVFFKLPVDPPFWLAPLLVTIFAATGWHIRDRDSDRAFIHPP
ncbi:MAG: hypothetical protein V3V30_09545 [Parvularculaceae bacterium]